MTWEVTSPHGPQPVAAWDCAECCEGSGGYQFREHGTGGEGQRDLAAAHVRRTGHRVMFYRGMAEDLYALSATPQPVSVTVQAHTEQTVNVAGPGERPYLVTVRAGQRVTFTGEGAGERAGEIARNDALAVGPVSWEGVTPAGEPIRVVDTGELPPRRCPDDGFCHHRCGEGGCFRVFNCSPLSGRYPGDCWPASVASAERARGDESVL